jgi:hypothetical protein
MSLKKTPAAFTKEEFLTLPAEWVSQVPDFQKAAAATQSYLAFGSKPGLMREFLHLTPACELDEKKAEAAYGNSVWSATAQQSILLPYPSLQVLGYKVLVLGVASIAEQTSISQAHPDWDIEWQNVNPSPDIPGMQPTVDAPPPAWSLALVTGSNCAVSLDAAVQIAAHCAIGLKPKGLLRLIATRGTPGHVLFDLASILKSSFENLFTDVDVVSINGVVTLNATRKDHVDGRTAQALFSDAMQHIFMTLDERHMLKTVDVGGSKFYVLPENLAQKTMILSNLFGSYVVFVAGSASTGRLVFGLDYPGSSRDPFVRRDQHANSLIWPGSVGGCGGRYFQEMQPDGHYNSSNPVVMELCLDIRQIPADLLSDLSIGQYNGQQVFSVHSLDFICRVLELHTMISRPDRANQNLHVFGGRDSEAGSTHPHS